MSTYVLRFQEIDRSKVMLAGGKGANLGESAEYGCRRVFVLPRKRIRE